MASASYDGTLKLWDLAATERPSGGMAAAAAAARMEAGEGSQEGPRHVGAAAVEEDGVAGGGGGEGIDDCRALFLVRWSGNVVRGCSRVLGKCCLTSASSGAMPPVLGLLVTCFWVRVSGSGRPGY